MGASAPRIRRRSTAPSSPRCGAIGGQGRGGGGGGRAVRAAARAAARAAQRAAPVRRSHHERRRRPMTASSRCIASPRARNDSFFYEIPKNELDKDFLWNTQIKKTTIGAGYGGQSVGSRVVRWVLQGRPRPAREHRLHAWSPIRPIRWRTTANMPAIIRAFPVAAYARERRSGHRRDGALHGGRRRSSRRAARVGGRGMDASRTFLEKAVVVSEEHQRRSDGDVHARGRGGGRRGAGGRRTRRPWRRRGAGRARPCSCITA